MLPTHLLPGPRFAPDLSSPVGRTFGVEITYRTSTGRLYHTFVAMELGFCNGVSTSDRCQSEDKLQTDQFMSNLHKAVSPDQLYRSGWWHG